MEKLPRLSLLIQDHYETHKRLFIPKINKIYSVVCERERERNRERDRERDREREIEREIEI